MKQPLVSIVVPVYNAAEFICRCVNSITEQTYYNLEIILVDDGSTDNSYTECQRMALDDNRIAVISQPNGGVVAARNAGIEFSHGDYLVFVDADDWIEPDMIDTLVNGIGDADIISFGVLWEKYPGREDIISDDYKEGVYSTQSEKNLFFSTMIFDLEKNKLHPLTPWMVNKLYKKELVKSVYPSIDRTITYDEDAIFVYKCFFKAESFVIIHKPFYHYYYNAQSACHSERRNMLTDINKVYLSLLDECRLYGEDENLNEQLQSWIALLVRVALNERMGFDKTRIHFSEFLFDARVLEKDTHKIVIYGAGQAGQDFTYQLRKLGYEISLWVDSNYSYWSGLGLNVEEPEKIRQVDYDEILIAVSDEKTASTIGQYLLELGIEKEKIKWSKPIVL